MSNLYAFAIGQTRTDSSGNPLDCYFPLPLKAPDPELAKLIAAHFEPGTHPDRPLSRSMSFLSAVGEQLASCRPAAARCRWTADRGQAR